MYIIQRFWWVIRLCSGQRPKTEYYLPIYGILYGYFEKVRVKSEKIQQINLGKNLEFVKKPQSFLETKRENHKNQSCTATQTPI